MQVWVHLIAQDYSVYILYWLYTTYKLIDFSMKFDLVPTEHSTLFFFFLSHQGSFLTEINSRTHIEPQWYMIMEYWYWTSIRDIFMKNGRNNWKMGITVAAIIMGLLLCCISCLAEIQLKKKISLHTEAYDKDQDLNKEFKKAYLCILHKESKKAFLTSVVWVKSVEVKWWLIQVNEACVKRFFARSVEIYKICSYPNILCKCPSKALSFSPYDCGFTEKYILEKQPTHLCFSELVFIWTNASYFNFLSFTVPESSTITVWWESDSTYNVVLLSPHAFQNLSNIRILYCSPSYHLS